MSINNQNPQPDDPYESDTPTTFLQKPWVKNTLMALLFLGAFLLIRPVMQGNVIEGQAPRMQVTTITGKHIDLQSLNQQGKPVLVHIWATWCPICSASRGSIESLSEDYDVINIATQSLDNDQLLAYAKEHEMNPDLIVNDLGGQWMKAFGAKAVPADFVIAPNSEIAFIEVGFTTGWGLRLRLWWSQL
ncbi:MAG: hypothetical protein ISEC1_P1528 [Thiomicrorhabdus sp.]|nr:MAG: hypothetical protein ISEC1_P1528 [Thiomicrorhabdus sp.]